MKTISRVCDSYAQASAAVSAVEAAGVPTSEVSLMANKYVSADYVDVDDVSTSAVGASIGGVIGGGAGLLAGLGVLAIPGLGPVVAADWLAAAAVVAVAGATAGGLVERWSMRANPMITPKSTRSPFVVAGTLVTARVQDQDGTRVTAIMHRFKPIDPVQRGADYREEGWKPFDAKAAAYRPSESELEGMRREGEWASAPRAT